MSLQLEIDFFFAHFESLHKSIIEATFSYGIEINKAILLCSVIDTLSKVVYPNSPNNERFIYFTDNFSGWDNTNKISLIQLYYYLKRETDPKYEQLKNYVNKKVGSMTGGKIYKTDIDDHIDYLKHLKVPESEILKFSYSRLLYKYRNCVIHESRTPGFGSNFAKSKEPHYYYLTHISEKPTYRTWELVFPVDYISVLVKNMIDKLKEHCTDNKINPYERYYIDTLWFPPNEVKKNKPHKNKL